MPATGVISVSDLRDTCVFREGLKRERSRGKVTGCGGGTFAEHPLVPRRAE